MTGEEWLSEISKKMDRLNKEGGMSIGRSNSDRHPLDPILPDPMQWQGEAALRWMEDQKKKE